MQSDPQSRDSGRASFWPCLDESETPPFNASKHDQTAVFKCVFDRALNARGAGDLQVCGGHHFGVSGGDCDPGARERSSEAQASGRGHRDMASFVVYGTFEGAARPQQSAQITAELNDNHCFDTDSGSKKNTQDRQQQYKQDRPSMGLLDEEDGEHPRREWSPSMGHEERIPIQIKDKRDHRQNPGPDPHPHPHNQHGSSCSASENLYPPQRPDYPQEAPHSSNLQQGVENRERDVPSRNPVRKIEPNTNPNPQPLAPVNPNCSNNENIDIIGVDNGSGMVKGRSTTRGQSAHMSNQAAASNNVECPHQKSPIQGHMSSFCCKVCGEAFSHMGHLHVHVQVHTREKPYRCGVCGKCCSSSGRLQEHQRSHTGEKPFRCQICGKGFTQMAHLKVHMRIHTGEKPYSCPVCGKCFSRSDKIKRHLQTHNRDGQYFSGQ